jgi:hypothetical protein
VIRTNHIRPRQQAAQTCHGRVIQTRGLVQVDKRESGLQGWARHSLKGVDHGTPIALNGVLLPDVLAKVSLPTGERFVNTSPWYYVLAEGVDGGRAVFSWAELDSTFTDRKVYVINKRDNQPLPEKVGPLQLMVPGEKRTTRWLRQLTALKINQAN